MNLEEAGSESEIEEVAADKGYHAAETFELGEYLDLRTYIPEPQRKHDRRWTDKPAEFQQAVYANRRRKAQQRQATSAPAERTLRTELRPRLRYGRRTQILVAKSGERE